MEKEALRLLSWLASSRAAEDINSADELARETILTPLLPATKMDKVLEKANMDFESESQQECQDILDSVDHSNNFEDSKGGSSSADHNYCLRLHGRTQFPKWMGPLMIKSQFLLLVSHRKYK